MKTGHTLNLIQLLRGVASLLVVLMHTTFTVNDTWHVSFFGNFFAFGGAGVDIFFVLSGFIITYTSSRALTQPGGFAAFLKRRAIRIFPSYWIIIIGFLVVQFALPSFYRTHYSLGGINLVNTFLLLPGHIMVNGVSWTLSYELFFYFLFSLAFIFRNRKILMIASAGYILFLIALTFSGFDVVHTEKWVNLVGFPMNAEFFMGIFAALIIPELSPKAAVAFIFGGCITFLASAVAADNSYFIFSNVFNRVVMFGIPAFFIIAGIAKYEITRQINMHSILVRLGEASYSLYLIHLPLVVGGIKIANRFIKQPGSVMQAAVIILVLMICAVSMLFFRWVEKPLINKLNAKRRSRSLAVKS